MLVRSLGKIIVSVLLAGSAVVPAAALFTSNVAYAEPQASGDAVQAAELALKGNFEDAGATARRSGDPAAIKLVELIYLRDHWKDAGFVRIMGFLDVAPKWPLAETLLKRAEQSLYTSNEPSNIILTYFANYEPVTNEGRLALARASLATGNEIGRAHV